jgi:hypothetical protein
LRAVTSAPNRSADAEAENRAGMAIIGRRAARTAVVMALLKVVRIRTILEASAESRFWNLQPSGSRSLPRGK